MLPTCLLTEQCVTGQPLQLKIKGFPYLRDDVCKAVTFGKAAWLEADYANFFKINSLKYSIRAHHKQDPQMKPVLDVHVVAPGENTVITVFPRIMPLPHHMQSQGDWGKKNSFKELLTDVTCFAALLKLHY